MNPSLNPVPQGPQRGGSRHDPTPPTHSFEYYTVQVTHHMVTHTGTTHPHKHTHTHKTTHNRHTHTRHTHTHTTHQQDTTYNDPKYNTTNKHAHCMCHILWGSAKKKPVQVERAKLVEQDAGVPKVSAIVPVFLIWKALSQRSVSPPSYPCLQCHY